MSFTIKMDVEALEKAIAGIQEDVSRAIRPAAQAGAQVLYEAVLSNVNAMGRKTGNLASSIYQAYSKSNSIDGVTAVYHISWNVNKAPHGRLLEYGYMQKYKVAYDPKNGVFRSVKTMPLTEPKYIPGYAFVRRAADRFGEAQEAMRKRFFEEMSK